MVLTASPQAGFAFISWSGACSGSGSCTVTMDADKTVTATFNPSSYTLSVSKAGAGSGTVSFNPAGASCGADCQSYSYGTAVTLTATPQAGSTFGGWSANCTVTNPATPNICQISITSDQIVTATFNAVSGSYYCDSDADSFFSSAVSGSCSGFPICIPAGCQQTAGNDCVDTSASIYPGASEAACNGLDNDCDGLIDEGYVSTATACGAGECASSGTKICQSGSEVDSCTPGTPTTEICDTKDNDCDGQTDEGCGTECLAGQTLGCSQTPLSYQGACAAKTADCVNGFWDRTDCEQGKTSNEVGLCTDNQDNDCDGRTDCMETIDCPAGNVCVNSGGNSCLASANCSSITYDWTCLKRPDSFCAGTGASCGVCVDTNSSPDVYQYECQSNPAACSGYQCGSCQDQGTAGTDFSCLSDQSLCTGVCSECSPSTLSCAPVTSDLDSAGPVTSWCDATHAPAGSDCGVAGGPPCICDAAAICVAIADIDQDGLADELDPCPYDPSNDADGDDRCAVGCLSGLSRYVAPGQNPKVNGYICNPAAMSVFYDVCQGSPINTDGNLNGIPDGCEVNSCKVVFGALDYLNIYIDGQMLTGNMFLPQYVSGNDPGKVIDYVYFNVNSFFGGSVDANDVIAFEAYDQGWSPRQIRGAFAEPNDSGLCNALSSIVRRTDPVTSTLSSSDLPVRCLAYNDDGRHGSQPVSSAWKGSGSFDDSAWAVSAEGVRSAGCGEIEKRLWYDGVGCTTETNKLKYNSPWAVWAKSYCQGGPQDGSACLSSSQCSGFPCNYSTNSHVFCRYQP